MTTENFIKTCKKYLTSKGCVVKEYYSYLTISGGMRRVCEFEYNGKNYRLTLDRYNIWKLYEHEPYPTEMKRYERVIQGEEVHCGIYEDINKSLDKFFEK